jgi:hypothetical protein
MPDGPKSAFTMRLPPAWLYPRFEPDPPAEDDSYWDMLKRYGQHAGNFVADTLLGTSPYADNYDPSGDLLGVMRGVGALGVMTQDSPLRNKAYRDKLLRQLGEQIDTAISPGPHQDMLRELVKTHPRVMASFEHAGGRLTERPAAEGLIPSQEKGKVALGRLITSTQSPFDVPGLRAVHPNPVIEVAEGAQSLSRWHEARRRTGRMLAAALLDTPQALPRVDPRAIQATRRQLITEDNPQYVGNQGFGAMVRLEVDDRSPGEVVPHEVTHWAQHLGSPISKAANRAYREGGRRAQAQGKKGALFTPREHRLLRRISERLEAGANTAGKHQMAQYTARHGHAPGRWSPEGPEFIMGGGDPVYGPFDELRRKARAVYQDTGRLPSARQIPGSPEFRRLTSQVPPAGHPWDYGLPTDRLDEMPEWLIHQVLLGQPKR